MYPYYTYIERIGLLDKQLLPEEEDMHASYHFARLRCYKDQEINYHRFSDMPCDTVPGYNDITGPVQVYKNVSIYPNPVLRGELLRIRLPDIATQELQIELYAISGRRLMNIRSSRKQQELSLDVDALAPGMYQLRVSCADKIIGQGGFVRL